MNIQGHLKKMKCIQKIILDFLRKDPINEEDYQNLFQLLNFQNITENKIEFKEFLHLLIKLTKNHMQTTNFSYRVEQILLYYKEKICENFTSYEIFNYCISSKQCILFLLENKIITPTQSMISIISSGKYLARNFPHFLFPEISSFLDQKLRNEIENNYINRYTLDEFQKLRKIGQNESYICQLIQCDSIDDFISYVNKQNIPLSSTIEASIFETNSFLLKNSSTLIEYAAFFGSVSIFKYLFLSKVKTTPSLLMHAIHSGNSEIIHILEECKMKIPDEMYQLFLAESIKCHQNEIAKYINENHVRKQEDDFILEKSIQYSNYKMLPNEICRYAKFFSSLCEGDYFYFVSFFLNEENLELTKNEGILKIHF